LYSSPVLLTIGRFIVYLSCCYMKSVKSTKDWLGNDRGIIWNDPDIAIAWPVQNPLVSDKDKKHPRLKSADINFKTK